MKKVVKVFKLDTIKKHYALNGRIRVKEIPTPCIATESTTTPLGIVKYTVPCITENGEDFIDVPETYLQFEGEERRPIPKVRNIRSLLKK